MPLDPKVLEMMREAFATHRCGERDGPPVCSGVPLGQGCGHPAARLSAGVYWCQDCWDRRYNAPPPVECRTSGDPNGGWYYRRGA